jgi:geranylgeranylglycerol-phosphate geranylgeranyltransferase
MELIRLTRPVDAVLFVAAALLGGWLAAGYGALQQPTHLLAAACAAALVGLAGNVVNDILDIEVDRANSPARPLPAGTVSTRAAWIFWAGLSLVGIVLGFTVSARHGLVAAGASLLLLGYAAWLKRIPLLGHVVVGAVVAFGLAFGALAVQPEPYSSGIVGGALALTFVLVTAREIVKAIPDIEGDRSHGVRTLPVAVGSRRSAFFAVGLIAVCIATIPLFPVIGYEPLFLVYAVPLSAFLLASAWTLAALPVVVRNNSAGWRAGAKRVSGWMKVALAVGTLALALGRSG